MYKYVGNYRRLLNLGFQKSNILGQVLYVKGVPGKWSIVVDSLIGMASYKNYNDKDSTPELWDKLVGEGLIIVV